MSSFLQELGQITYLKNNLRYFSLEALQSKNLSSFNATGNSTHVRVAKKYLPRLEGSTVYEKIENKKMEISAGGRSENMGRQSIIQALLKEEVLLLIQDPSIRPKSARANSSPSPLIPKELNIQWLPNEVLLKIFRSSTCPLTGFFGLWSHVTYLKLTRVLYECLLFQAE